MDNNINIKQHKARKGLLFVSVLFRIFWYCIRQGINPAVLSRLNPGLPKGGAGSLPKSKNYEYIVKNNPTAKKYFARFICIPSDAPWNRIKSMLKTFGNNPIVLKPDKGSRSIGVAITTTDSERMMLLKKRGNYNYIAQEFIPYNLEIGVFYYKYPDWKSGKILGIAEKMEEGDDKKMLYYDRPDLITPEITRRFNDILKDKEIYFCRFDVKIKSFEDFKKNNNFKILEVNIGPDAVMLHALDPKYDFRQKSNNLMAGYRHAFNITEKLKHKPKSHLIPYVWFLLKREIPLQILKFKVGKLKNNN